MLTRISAKNEDELESTKAVLAQSRSELMSAKDSLVILTTKLDEEAKKSSNDAEENERRNDVLTRRITELENGQVELQNQLLLVSSLDADKKAEIDKLVMSCSSLEDEMKFREDAWAKEWAHYLSSKTDDIQSIHNNYLAEIQELNRTLDVKDQVTSKSNSSISYTILLKTCITLLRLLPI